MAIFHLSVKVFSRSKGHSAVAAASYRAGVNMRDDRTGELHEYAKRKGVIREASALILPECAPNWSRAQLWNAVEQAETRKNSTVAREVEVSLPHELTSPQRIELAHEFTRWLVDRYGFAAEVNVHTPTPKKDDWRNGHAHIELSTRKLTADGFSEKIRILDAIKTGAPEVVLWRAEWARRVNAALEKHGHDARIDHRSNVERGLDAIPTVHVGHGPRAYQREDLNREINAWNAEAEALRNEVKRVQAVVAFEEQLTETRRAQEAVKAEEDARAKAIEAARAEAEAKAQAAAEAAAAQEEASKLKAEAVARAEAAAQQAITAVIQQRAEAARLAVAKAIEDEAAKARAEAAARQAEKTAAAAALASVLEAVKTVKQLAETKAALAVINADAMKIKEQLDRAKPAREVNQALYQASKMNVAIDDAKAAVKAVREEFDQLPWWRLITKRSMSAQIDASQAQLTAWSLEYREVKKTAQAPVRDDLIKRKVELDQEREKLLKRRDELIEKIAAEDALNANPETDSKLRFE